MKPNTNSNSRMPRLGEGIYSTDDVADILKLDYHKVKYLMRGFWAGHTLGTERNKTITFLSLIEFYIYYYLREHGFSGQWIKKLHAKLSRDFNTSYPFASLKIKTHKKKEGIKKGEVWIDFHDYLMMADGKLQPSFRTFIEPFLDNIEYGDDLLAKKYYPVRNSKNIVIDPKRQFGKPIINEKGVRTEVVYGFHLGGEKNENICKLYDLEKQEVEDAILYHHERAA